MKILIINNDTSFLSQLKKSLIGNTIKVTRFNKIKLEDIKKFDKIILSGGHGLNVKDHKKEYSKEIILIKKINKPILGICLGFELIGSAFGEKLTKLKKKEEGIILIKKIRDDKIIEGITNFKVFESHKWAINKTRFMISIARSKDGIEIIKHPKKQIYATQFHPERSIGNTEERKIIRNFLKI